MSVLIRPAGLSDTESISAIFLLSQAAAMPWLPVSQSVADTRWWIRTTLIPSYTVWVAEQAGQAVGFIQFSGNMINQLYVHPLNWKKGIGAELLAAAQDQPLNRLGLSVFQRNARARRFCERHDFKLITLGTGSENEEGEPDAYYEWYRPTPVITVL